MKRFCEASTAFEAARCRHLQLTGERFYIIIKHIVELGSIVHRKAVLLSEIAWVFLVMLIVRRIICTRKKHKIAVHLNC